MSENTIYNFNAGISNSLYLQIKTLVSREAWSWKDRAALEDLVQDVAEAIWKYRHLALKDGALHIGYARKILKSRIGDYGRSKNKESRIERHLRTYGWFDDVSRRPNSHPAGFSDERSDDFSQDIDRPDAAGADDDVAGRDCLDIDLASDEIISKSDAYLLGDWNKVDQDLDQPGDASAGNDVVDKDTHHIRPALDDRRSKASPYYPEVFSRDSRPPTPHEELERDELWERTVRHHQAWPLGLRKQVFGYLLEGETDGQSIAARLGRDVKPIAQAISFVRKELRLSLQTAGML